MKFAIYSNIVNDWLIMNTMNHLLKPLMLIFGYTMPPRIITE